MRRRILFGLLFAVILGMTACNDSGKEKKENNQQAGQVAPAEDPLVLLNDSIKMDPNRAELYLRRAMVYLDQLPQIEDEAKQNEQIGLAMLDVSNAIQMDPNNVDALLLLSHIYYLIGDEANITPTLKHALEVDPFDARPLVKLAELNLLKQDYNQTFAYLDNALKVDSYNPQAYFVKGMAYMARQDTVSALKNFLIAREQDPSFYEPQHEISLIYWKQHNPLTESFMRSMMVNFPDKPMVRYDLAMYLQDNGNPEEALSHYDTLLMLQPSNSRLLYNKGYVNLVYLGDYQSALMYFEQSLQSDPNYIDALYNKGRVLEEMGDYVRAQAIYSQVLSRYPNYPLAVEGMNRVSNQN